MVLFCVMTAASKKLLKQVLFLSPFPPPFGGVATLTKILFEKGLPAPYRASVIDTRSCSSKTDSFFLRLVGMFQRESRIILKLITYLILRKPKIVHLNCSVSPVGVHRDLLCIFLARLAGVPTLCHYHGNVGDFNVQEKYLFSNFSLRYLMKFNSINIFSNIPSLNSAIAKFGLENDQQKNYIIPNYASDKVWKYEHKAVEKKTLRCVFVGNLSKAKGTDLIIQLAKMLPEFQFDLIGNMGTDIRFLLDQDVPSNIKLCGAMEQVEVYTNLESADIFLFPSLTEGFPLSIVEAMSIGLPVICTSVGSLPEMIDEGKGGFILPPGDVEAFRESLLKLADYESRKSMGLYNRIKSRREYNFDSVAKRLVDSYNKIS
jgi:glycosyltransferase involved in cell wall biosynthesis